MGPYLTWLLRYNTLPPAARVLSLAGLLHIVGLQEFCMHGKSGMLYANGATLHTGMLHRPIRPHTEHVFQDKTIKSFKMAIAEDETKAGPVRGDVPKCCLREISHCDHHIINYHSFYLRDQSVVATLFKFDCCITINYILIIKTRSCTKVGHKVKILNFIESRKERNKFFRLS